MTWKLKKTGINNYRLDDFVVPFEQNPWFTGRKEFLEILKEKLFDQTPKKYNHRIALYGMGGIGKTQTALEYVYTNRDSYERIYWITAVDQASLLSGYQKIAIKAGLKALLNLKPVEIAEGVLSWLRQEQSWLIVIDNLDDIDVATGFLPQNGPHKHTLITTRNPNSAWNSSRRIGSAASRCRGFNRSSLHSIKYRHYSKLT